MLAGDWEINYYEAGQALSETILKDNPPAAKKDYTNYFTTSLKSANESKLWLSLLKDSNRAKSEHVEPMLKELDEISKIFASSILTLKGRK